MTVCRNCGVADFGLSDRCGNCNESLTAPEDRPGPLDFASLTARATSIAAELAILGGLLMVSGPFLPFAELGATEYHGPLTAGVESVPMICAGAVATVFGIMSLVIRRRFAHWYVPCAAATAATTFYCQLAVENSLLAQNLTPSTWGLGAQFCYLGALLSLMAGAVCLAQTPIVPLRKRLAGAASSLMDTSFRPRAKSELMFTWEARRRSSPGSGKFPLPPRREG